MKDFYYVVKAGVLIVIGIWFGFVVVKGPTLNLNIEDKRLNVPELVRVLKGHDDALKGLLEKEAPKK